MVKNHIRENKKTYLIGAGCLVLGALTCGVTILLISKNAESGTKIVQKINQIAWRPENNQVVINLIERSTPSKPVHLVGTNLYWSSISEAARETGNSFSVLSKNLNGHTPDIKGDIFEFLEKAA
jgi:hypothetical protein